MNKIPSVQYIPINSGCVVVQLIPGRFLSCITEAQGLQTFSHSSSSDTIPLFAPVGLDYFRENSRITQASSPSSPFHTKGKIAYCSQQEGEQNSDMTAQELHQDTHSNLKLDRWFMYN